MPEPVFQAWPKIARLNRDIVVSEKIDGTNAAVQVIHWPGAIRITDVPHLGTLVTVNNEPYQVVAQSRNRLISIQDDNYGFAKWVSDNAAALVETLGEGTHFGEWWGRKIARGYEQTERTFSLFNTSRWTKENTQGVEGLSVVPTLYFGPYSQEAIASSLRILQMFGSEAAPGFRRPEGVVIFHTASNVMFKVTLENDEKPKGQK